MFKVIQDHVWLPVSD